MTILITGAAGEIGASLRIGLRGRFPRLRLLDIQSITDIHPSEIAINGDLFDMNDAVTATRGVDCVVHLAGVPRENAWDPILRNNIAAVYNLFEACRQNRVKRIIYASSNHVIGFYRRGREIHTDEPIRPDSRYGVSKVFGEALGRLYADKHGVEFIALRIGSFRAEPRARRELATWISPRDLAELVYCCIVAEPVHYVTLYGVSANTRNRWKDEAQRLVGFMPQDNGEDFVAQFPASYEGEGVAELFHGGGVCAAEFSGDMKKID